MPFSLLPEDALKSFGIQAGLHRIVDLKWMVHQYPASKDTGKQSDPFVCLAVTYLPIDVAGKAIGDAQTSYDLKVAPKFGDSIEKAKFAPASAPGQALPLRVGSAGPYIEAVGDQTGFYESSKIMKWLNTLFSLSFDQARLKASNFNLQILIGTEGDIYELVSENDGTDAATGQKFKPTKFPAFKSIRKFGYDGGAQNIPSATQGTQGTVASSPASSPASNGAVSGDAYALAVTLLGGGLKERFKTEHAVDVGLQPLPTVTVDNLLKGVMPVFMKLPTPRPSVADRTAAADLLKSADFYNREDVGAIAFFEADGPGIITFA